MSEEQYKFIIYEIEEIKKMLEEQRLDIDTVMRKIERLNEN